MMKFIGFALAVLLVSGLTGSAAVAQTVQNVLAAQIRTQGYPCDQALGAKKDIKRSKPDHDVWVLRCSNATFRISRAPDLAAKVEVLQ
jgi:hypothetical protein